MASTIYTAAELDEDFLRALENGSITHAAIAREYGFNEKSVRRWRLRNGVELAPPGPVGAATTPDNDVQKGSVTVTSTGAEINNVVVTSPINKDWSSVFALFNLDASEFEVVDDTVRMSTWQQSKRTDDGERDTIQLYAYSARFRKIGLEDVTPTTVERWRVHLIESDLPSSGSGGNHGTYVMLVADPQLGKKGTEEAVENWKRGVNQHLQAADFLSPEKIHIAFMGDEHEGVMHNYPNQPYTVEMNFTRQLELDYDMRVWTIRQAARLGIPLSGSSVISNHGEWTRNGKKDVVTTRNDNSSTHIARQVKKLFDEAIPWGGPTIDWTIGDGAPGILVNLSGRPVHLSHGYVEKGKGGTTEARMQNAVERQILGDTENLGSVPLWFVAHYHHAYFNTFADRTLWGCPALEAEKSSEYMLEQYGVWSPAGMLGMMVGTYWGTQGWANANIF